MQAYRPIAYIIVVVMQTALLGGMIVKRTALLETGQSALLKCVPVDPRSLISGDYVRLNYEISRFTADDMERLNVFNESFKKHAAVYVALEKPTDGKFHRAVALSSRREKLQQAGRVIVRGTAQDDFRPPESDAKTKSIRVALQVRYGVEEYFVPQFEGKKIERRLEQAHVEVAVADSGESAIRKLFIDDKEVTFY